MDIRNAQEWFRKACELNIKSQRKFVPLTFKEKLLFRMSKTKRSF